MNDESNMERDLAYFRELQYDVVVKKKRGRFFALIPELSIVEEDENLDKAYEKLDVEKETYFQKMIESNYEEYIKEPAGRERNKRVLDIPNIIQYLVKFIITAFLVISIGIVGMKIAFNQINQIRYETIDNVNKIKREVLGKFKNEHIVRNVEAKLYRIKDMINNLTPERKEEIILELRKTIKNIKPFFDEFGTLLEGIPKDAPERELSRINSKKGIRALDTKKEKSSKNNLTR